MSDFLGVLVTDDGEHLLLGFGDPDDALELAIPKDLWPKIMSNLIQGYGKLLERREELGVGGEEGDPYLTTMNVENFEIAVGDQGEWALYLLLKEGPKLQFVMPDELAEQLQETLRMTFSSGRKKETPSSVH